MTTIMHPEFFRDLQPDSKLQMLKQLSSQAEIIIVISAKDIEKNKVRGDLGITYDSDVLRLMDSFHDNGLYVGSVVITQFSGQESALMFRYRLEKLEHQSLYALQYPWLSFQCGTDCQ